MAIQYNQDGTVSSFGGGGSFYPGGGVTSPREGDRSFGGSPFMGMNDSAFTPHILSMTPTGGMGGMNGGLMSSLIQSMNSSQNQQRADSLKQYKALLATVAGTRQNVEGQFNQLGRSGMQQIGLDQQNQLGGMNQSLVSRGLGNTTIANTMANGINRNAMFEKQNLQSGIAGQKIGAEMGLGQMQGDAILSKQNVPPNLGMYLSLIQSLAGGGRAI